MNSKSDKVIITESLDGIGTGVVEMYLAHALCTSGSAVFRYNDRRLEFREGDLLIVRKGWLVEDFNASPDFKVRVIYVDPLFIEVSTPLTNYGMKGSVALFFNPVMRLDRCQFEACMSDFSVVEARLNAVSAIFYEEGLRCAVQLMILDFFEFHASIYGQDVISSQSANIMSRFFRLLDSGLYRKNREVSFYASELCVSPKYLSEVCRKTSGHSANFWVNRYTSLEISRLLRDKSLTFVQITDMFNFSSQAYFSRYVQRNLGKVPSEYRE